MLTLGIETSCDETGIALYDSEQGLLAHEVYSQIALHKDYGGVVPELASRDHIQKTIPLIQQVLAEAGKSQSDLTGIAYTAGPGLIGALLVGATIGRTLAWALGVPAIGVHHMEGHLLAPMLEENKPDFPFIALLVSGGHTQLIQVDGLGQYHLLGDTLDDAVGEAFDKTAKLLGLDYPGGAALAELATLGRAGQYQFPRPMVNRPGLDFSFSGLKTFAMNTVHGAGNDPQTLADIAYAFQEAVVDTLLIKCRRAIKQCKINRLVVAGGVSANQLLRQKLKDYMFEIKGEVFYPRHEFCTDNGAMIAYVGHVRLQAGQADDTAIKARARWPITELTPTSQKK